MKTFKDLVFKPHKAGDGLQASLHFDNGYGVSVIRFKISPEIYGSYTDNEQEWELGIFKNRNCKKIEGGSCELCEQKLICLTKGADASIDDVMGHLSEAEVTEQMKEIQQRGGSNGSKGKV